jgi:L-asparaginase
MVDQGARGIVLATAGAGATSGTQGEGVRYAIEKGVYIVTSTRTGSGRIAARRRPSAPAGSSNGQPTRPATLRIAAEDLAPIKARILLMLALTKTTDGAEIQRMFTEY